MSTTTVERAAKVGQPGYAAHTDQGAQTIQMMEDLVAKCEELGTRKASDLPEKYQKEISGIATEVARVNGELKRDIASVRKRMETLASNEEDEPHIRSALGGPRRTAAFAGLVKAIAHRKFDEWMAQFPDYAQGWKPDLLTPGVEVASIDPSTGPVGGYAVPETLLPGIIRNVEEYGVFEQEATVYPMPTQGGSIIKRAGGMTCSYPDLATSPTETTPTLSKINVNLTTYSTLSYVDRFMLMDSLRINLVNLLMQEIGLTFAYSQDLNAFIGDGTSTYAGVSGLLRSGTTHITASANDVTADTGDDTFAEVIAATTKYLSKCMGACPAWVIQRGMGKWYMHSSVFFSYLGQRDSQNRPLADVFNTAGGQLTFRLMNMPVRLVQVAPALSATAVSKPMAVFGDLKAGMGLARSIQGMELLESAHARFVQNQYAYLANMRQDIKAVDTTAYSRLITAAA